MTQHLQSPESGRNISSLPGVYVHIPFCSRKCRYCDFHSVCRTDRIPEFVTALGREMELAAEHWATAAADTLYIGGGTPSLLSPGQMEKILVGAVDHFHLSASSDISVEANPGTLDKAKLEAYAALGCNRLNIGIQSFNNRQLAFLGRIHDARQALNIFHDARTAGFDDIGIDLIYGLPGQTRAMWRQDLEIALDLHPEHISCYMLTYEPGTALTADLQAGRFAPAGERLCADLFRLTHECLTQKGYEHYEISNFAKSPSFRSRHNQKYWNFVPYAGLGPSAHSYDPHSCNRIARYWNVADLNRYLEQLERGRLPRNDREILTRGQQMMEAVYLGLRQADGIDIAFFRRCFNTDFANLFQPVLDRLFELDWIVLDEDRCRPTLEGMLFMDRMVGDLVERVDEV